MLNETVSVDDLRSMLESGRRITVLDVRPAAERAELWIPGSLHIDVYNRLKAGDTAALSDFRPPRDTLVVTVCASGKTSLVAAEQLRGRGVTACSLEGGMRAWSLAWNLAEVPVTGLGETRIVQVRRTGKGCLSYLIGSSGGAVVIDPSLAPRVYLNLAEERGWRVEVVLETHIHADHLSRARSLARQASARLLYPEQDRLCYPHDKAVNGEQIAFGGPRLEALHTPGHTWESTCYLLEGKALFSGDTLFLDGVGRPDLHAGTEERLTKAHALYGSLQRLRQLPPNVLVLPSHTGKPAEFDGRPLVSTLADLFESVALLGCSEDEFVRSILARTPPTPPNHLRIIEHNEAGDFPEEDVIDLEAGANRCAVA
ncbi:MAG: MBL fold metallo-hydrolase [Acidobacteriota bacterium]